MIKCKYILLGRFKIVYFCIYFDIDFLALLKRAT